MFYLIICLNVKKQIHLQTYALNMKTETDIVISVKKNH